MNELVTGDAVVLELRLAKLASRSLAFAIDLLVMITAFVALAVTVIAVLPSSDDGLRAAVMIVLGLGVFVAYPVALESLTRGRSIGKIALGLRVVRSDGGPIRFRHALARGLAGLIVDFGVVSMFTGAVGLISSLASPRGCRVGDMLAGTVVVRERVPAPSRTEPSMPPVLAGWAGSLELSGLPDPLALSARQFLSRVDELAPDARHHLGSILAGQVAAVIGPANPVPPGTPAEHYLAAVLVERRRREAARLAALRPAVPAQRAAGPTLPAPSPDDTFAPPR